MIEKIDIDNKTLTHLLGYLKPDSWADALKYDHVDKQLVAKLVHIQEQAFCFDLHSDVNALGTGEGRIESVGVWKK